MTGKADTSFSENRRCVGIDTGGTFTDFVFVDADGRVRVDKRPSNPYDPAEPILEGMRDFTAEDHGRIVHGTTVATNALLENKVAPTALITTAGFEDVIEIGRQDRPVLYALHPKREPALIPRHLRFGVAERVDAGGRVLVALDEAEIRRVLDEIRRTDARALAICLLHSYKNDIHERMIERAAESLGIPISVSSDVLPEFREYERTSTVCVNACLQPIMQGYLDRIDRGAGNASLSVMQSAGGIIPARIAARLPVHTVLSGPAGGVIAAAQVARTVGLERVITFDMGGTSTDVSLYDGKPALSADKTIGGRPIRIPVIDIHTVGAGGGSIAYRDTGGSLKVGPESAGADPGPICYGKGDRVTVTDANLFLGRLDPSFFLGGRMVIDPDRVRAPMENLGRELGLDPVEAARGVLTVANAVMERAVRVISIERGHDPRDFSLVSFGGAGGLHAVDLARNLGIPTVLVPPNAGVFSAFGMVTADIARDRSLTILKKIDEFPVDRINALYGELVRRAVEELATEGVPPEKILSAGSLDMRYVGQSYELSVAFGPDPERSFHEIHERRYGFSKPQTAVEVVTVRARVFLGTSSPPPLSLPIGPSDPSSALVRTVRSPGFENPVPVPVFDRSRLHPGAVIFGPALIGDSTGTVWLPGGSRGAVDGFGNFFIRV